MRYSAFEQAAAEATIGMKEVDSQLERLRAQVEQLKSKRDLLENLSRQLLAIRPVGNESAMEAGAAPMPEASPAEQPLSGYAASEGEGDLAAMSIGSSPRSLRESGWFNTPADGIRGRL